MSNIFKADGYFVRRHKPTIREVKASIMSMMLSDRPEGAIHYLLCRDDFDREWSIVIGWREYDETDEPQSACNRDGVHLVAEIGWQPYNAGMQTDIDWDWNLPSDYDEDGKTADVFDTSVWIAGPDDAKMVVDDLWKSWMEIKKHWLKRPKL
jgi:hypothetical protein